MYIHTKNQGRGGKQKEGKKEERQEGRKAGRLFILSEVRGT